MGSEKNYSISAAQIRAARAILEWSQENLAAATNFSIATVRKLELGHISPRHATTQCIRQVLEDAGLEFIEPDGVRRRPEGIVVYQGREAAKAFFDDVYHTLVRKPGDLIAVCPSEGEYFVQILGEYQHVHVERMTAIKESLAVKCILTEDKTILPAASYCEYRWISKHYVDSVPFYVYDNKYAIIVFNAQPSPKITVIQSRVVADAFRHQFYSMWEKATPLNTLNEKTFLGMKKRPR